jgi:RNA polymerase primary sigma factor
MAYLTVDRRALSREDEARLSLAAQAGDVRARNTIVEANIPLVMVVVKQIAQGPGPLAEDLVQEGTLGLIKAVEHFEPHRRIAFSTYAVWWIRAYLFRWIAANRCAVKSRPGVASTRPLDVSIDEPAYKDGEEGRVASMPDPAPSAETTLIRLEQQAIVRRTVKQAANQAMARTSDPKVADIVKRRILSNDPETLQSIGNRWGVSREWIRQVEAQVLPTIHRAVIKRLAG